MKTLLLLFVLAGIVGYFAWRWRKERRRQRLRAAWQARRAEEDRIWHDRMGDP